MKRTVLAAVLFMAICFQVFAQDSLRIGWEYRGLSFDAFAAGAEKRLQLRFLYDENQLTDIITGDYGENPYLYTVLDSLFKNRRIYYYRAPGDNIILTRDFAIRDLRSEMQARNLFIPSEPEADSRINLAPGQARLAEIGNPADRNLPGRVGISGYVRDEDTKEPVAGVTVFVPGISAGTLTNSFGFYSLALPRGSHEIRYTFIGMREMIYDLRIYSSGELNVEMKSVLVPLKGAVITAEKDITLIQPETGVEKVSIATLKLQPTAMGETDVLKSMLMIPGVNTVGEGSAGFNVRGGSADQNLILLYGAPLYNSSHFFGFFSAINSEVINDVTLYKGGIPSKYGGRLSSVMDVTARDGNRKEFRGNAGISPVTAQFMAEGPIKKDTLYWILAGRATYSDWILRILDDPALQNSSAAFQDLNARLSWDLNRKNSIDISAYVSHDGFRLNSDTSYNYVNNILSARWRHYFNNRFFSTLTASNSHYSYDILSTRVPEESFRLSHNINSTSLKADFNYFAGRNDLNFGAELTVYGVNPGKFMPEGDSSLVIPEENAFERALEPSLYFEDRFKVNDFLNLSGGIRLSSFFTAGPKTVYVYQEGGPLNEGTVNDTILYSRNDLVSSYAGPELRLSANFRINRFNSLKLNYNRTRQYLHLLTNSAAISPTDTWKLSDTYTEPMIGDQYAAGFYHLFGNDRIEFSSEVYYKRIQNMADFKEGSELVMNTNIEQDLIYTEGRAYGLEILLQKPEGRVRWNMGYTYSRILQRSTGIYDEETINGGNWFPANYDRPHSVILSLNYIYSRRVSISAAYNYSTGRPVTYPVTSYAIGDIMLTHYSDRNRYRIPDYSRFDLSVRISGNLRSGKIAHPHWIFSVYNLTGRDNVYSAYFKNDKNKVQGYYLSVFDRPVPTISFNFDF